jgi:hypothetical protein
VTDDQKDLVLAYKATFATETGKKVLEHLRRVGNIHSTRLVRGNGFDVNQLIFDEAQRAFVLEIVRKVEMVLGQPVQTVAITKEQKNG